MTLSLPTEDQQALVRGVADFLAGGFPLARFREGRARDADRWGELAGHGVLGIALAEVDGGLGLGVVEQALVARELGRALISPAAIAGMLAPLVAAGAGKRQLGVALAAGESRVGVALGALDGAFRVIDADDGLFLKIDENSLSLIESDQRPLRPLDETLILTAAALRGRVVVQIEAPDLVLAAHLLAAGFLTGLLETVRDMAAEYARTRVQFARPIGAFQAIKHRCADAALGAELAWCQLWAAAHALAAGQSDAAFQVRAAKWLAGDEALKAARFAIQAHGGMGFTQECDAQLLLKRAHVLNQMFGNPRLVPAQLIALPVEV